MSESMNETFENKDETDQSLSTVLPRRCFQDRHDQRMFVEKEFFGDDVADHNDVSASLDNIMDSWQVLLTASKLIVTGEILHTTPR